MGFKDDKHSHIQIALGLLKTENGYPLDYGAFLGNSFEGHTMLPEIERFKTKYKLENLTVFADAGLIVILPKNPRNDGMTINLRHCEEE